MIPIDFAAWNMQNILIRVIVAAILGGIVGLDRRMKHRGAGTKTITVVCLGATLVMLTEQYGDVKKLQGINGYRLRVGNYRIIFSRNDNVLYIERIDNREQIYKEV